LKATLKEDPSSSLGAVARRFGHDAEYLKKHFPQLCQAISKRHAELTKTRTMGKTEDAKQRIRQFAIDLYAQGLYPSAHRLRRELNQPTGLERTQLSEVLRDVRNELGISRSYFRANGRFE